MERILKPANLTEILRGHLAYNYFIPKHIKLAYYLYVKGLTELLQNDRLFVINLNQTEPMCLVVLRNEAQLRFNKFY